jgi:hypothetical protein
MPQGEPGVCPGLPRQQRGTWYACGWTKCLPASQAAADGRHALLCWLMPPTLSAPLRLLLCHLGCS